MYRLTQSLEVDDSRDICTFTVEYEGVVCERMVPSLNSLGYSIHFLFIARPRQRFLLSPKSTYAGNLGSQTMKPTTMSKKFNPKVVAEKLIEFVSAREQVDLAQDLSPATLTKMATLDVDVLEHDGRGIGSVLDIDWNSALASVEQDARIEEALVRVGQTLLNKDESDLQYVESIEAHLNEEFELSLGATEAQWWKENLFQKVSCLSVMRVPASLGLHSCYTYGN